MIRAFLFDLDGVLTDTSDYHYLVGSAWVRTLESHLALKKMRRCAVFLDANP